MKTEPAVIISTVTAFLVAVIGTLIAFGADITDEQKNAVISSVAPLVGVIFLLGPIIRTFVFSPKSTQKLVDNAEQAGATNSPAPVVQP